MKKQTVRMDADDSALEIWVALEAAGEEGRTMKQIRKSTGLTVHQFRRGKKRIDDVLVESNGQPIAYDPFSTCYFLPDQFPDYLPWAINRQRDMLTRAKHQASAWVASTKRWPRTPTTRYVSKCMARVAEDIEDALSEVESAVR